MLVKGATGNRGWHGDHAAWVMFTVGKRNAHLRRGYTPMPLATRPCAASGRLWQTRVRIRVKNAMKAGTLCIYRIFVERGW